MIRKFAAWLIAAALLLAAASPAAAGPFVVTRFLHPATVTAPPVGGTSPDVLPGAVAANTTFNTITPAQHGSSGDSAYNMRGFCRFTQVPLVEVGQSGVNGTRQIGVVCAHAAGDSEVAAGIASNIDHVDCRVDGGAWYTATGQTSDADAGGITDWNCTVNSQNFSDGLHQMDFRAVPTIGPDIVMEGPLEDANHYATARLNQAMISDGTGAAPGNVLTVSGNIYNINDVAGVSSLLKGYSLSGVYIAPNTFIDKTNADDATYTGTGGTGTYHVTGSPQLTGAATFTATISGTTMTVSAIANGSIEEGGTSDVLVGPGVTAGTLVNGRGDDPATKTRCTPNCTGTGGVGTYSVSVSQTVASPVTMTTLEPMVAGNERSFYFITDFHNTLGRGVHVVYVADAANGGSDSNSGLDAAHPKLNPTTAAALIKSDDTNATLKGKWGGVVCELNNSAWTSDTGTGTFAGPDASLGWLKYQSASYAPCVHPGDTGRPGMTFNSSDRTWGGLRVWYNGLFLNGPPNTLNSSLATQLVAQNTITVAPGKLTDGTSSNSLLGQGGYACLEAQITFTQGGCGTPLVRNTTVTNHNNQGFHNTEVVLNSTESGGGPNYGFATGASTVGSTVITGVTVPAGYSISDLFNTSSAGACNASNIGCIGVAATSGGVSCFPNTGASQTTLVGLDNTAHTITTDVAALSSCTGSLMYPGVHGDIVQFAVNFFAADIYWANNTGGAVFPGCEQGFFVEQRHVSGIYAGNNHFENLPGCGMTNTFLAGANDNVILDHNVIAGSTGARVDTDGTQLHASDAETFVGDTCTTSPGGTMNGSGTRIRRKAAASSACYTSQ